MESKIKYQCKNCGWETSIREEWGDLKPKRCMNRKCNTSFLANRDALIINRPEPKKERSSTESKKHGKTSRKSQKSSQAVEQQSSEAEKSS